ncbi:MAG: cysteine desulfurase [Planctomycetes bacterium]|nr:cysteine desulfurase [Planctomycetota bacterium]
MDAPTIAYLDNAATTRCDPRAAAEVSRFLLEEYGNPSSVHPLGVAAARALREARETLARCLEAEPGGVVFTSGGTEADDLAVLGFARTLRRHGRHLVVGATEHPAVLEAAKALGEEGFETSVVPADRAGRIDPAAVASACRPDTVVVAVMMANNELGTLAPVSEIARAVRTRAPRAAFHVDAVQAFGKAPVSLRATGADSIALSSHKIHGPKGVGALVLAPGRRPAPLLHGGGQEGNLRSGTENLPGIAGFARAAALAVESLAAEVPRWRRLRERLERGLAAALPDRLVNGDPERSVPTILSVTFPGVPGEALLHHLEARGVLVSTGAACHSRRGGSHVLLACGMAEEAVRSTIRFSFGRFTSEADVDRAVAAVPALVAELRALSR